ncbi:MAG: transketolase C-terminal domain-containing protein, partial [Bacteroidales bacterium]
PLDEDALIWAADTCGAMITVEEHSVHGGLGEACASVLMQNGRSIPFRIVGIPDEDTATGSQGEIFAHYGITGKDLSEMALDMIKQKG